MFGNDALLKDLQFDMLREDICTTQSRTAAPETWTLYNLSDQIHNFHIHQVKFDVAELRGSLCTAGGREGISDKDGFLLNPETPPLINETDLCWKNYAELYLNMTGSGVVSGPPGVAEAMVVPTTPVLWENLGIHDTFPIPPLGYIKIKISFDKPEHVGKFVFHCHIMEHEDTSMMVKIVVYPEEI